MNSLARNAVNVLRKLAAFSSLGTLGNNELEKLCEACKITAIRCEEVLTKRLREEKHGLRNERHGRVDIQE